MTFKQVLIFIFSILIIGVFGLVAQGKLTDEQKKAIDKITKTIDMAPDFSFEDINGDIYTLSELKGKVVVVNFWATWCGPCRMEIPEFNDLLKKHSDDDLVILGLSISDSKKALKNFSKSYRIDYPLLFGTSKQIDEVSRRYGGIYSVPQTFLIGRDGSIKMSYPGAIIKGYPIHNQFISDINRALAEKTN
ncbi:MAG: peroxiredoxin family protein [Fidelibacterota bacterium]